jgi:hypothetical protein
MQDLTVYIDNQNSEDVSEDDVLDDFVETIRRRAEGQSIETSFVVPLADLFGLQSRFAEKCLVIALLDKSPREIAHQSGYAGADVRTATDGTSLGYLFLAKGHVAVSKAILREIDPREHDRLVVLWLLRDSELRLCEYDYTDEMADEFSQACKTADRLNDRKNGVGTANNQAVFFTDALALSGKERGYP